MRVMLAVPCQDQVAAGFTHDLAAAVGATVASMPDLDLGLYIEQGTVLSRVRERLAEEAVARGFDGIVWLDSDMRFPPETLLRLCLSGESFLAANCPTRRVPILPTAWGADGPLYTEEGSPEREAVERVGLAVAYTGAHLFTTLPQPWFPQEWDDSIKDYTGEDVAFCRAVRLAGHTITVDHVLSRQVRHVGVMDYTHGHALVHKARTLVRA